jgi:hypothetical protein
MDELDSSRRISIACLMDGSLFLVFLPGLWVGTGIGMRCSVRRNTISANVVQFIFGTTAGFSTTATLRVIRNAIFSTLDLRLRISNELDATRVEVKKRDCERNEKRNRRSRELRRVPEAFEQSVMPDALRVWEVIRASPG